MELVKMGHAQQHRDSISQTMARLKAALDAAWQANVDARAEFDRVIESGPHPEGNTRIHSAGGAMNLALKNYIGALKRFSEFAIHGTIPDDPDPTS